MLFTQKELAGAAQSTGHTHNVVYKRQWSHVHAILRIVSEIEPGGPGSARHSNVAVPTSTARELVSDQSGKPRVGRGECQCPELHPSIRGPHPFVDDLTLRSGVSDFKNLRWSQIGATNTMLIADRRPCGELTRGCCEVMKAKRYARVTRPFPSVAHALGEPSEHVVIEHVSV